MGAGSLWPLKNNYQVLEEKQLLCLNSVADFHVYVTTNFFLHQNNFHTLMITISPPTITKWPVHTIMDVKIQASNSECKTSSVWANKCDQEAVTLLKRASKNTLFSIG